MSKKVSFTIGGRFFASKAELVERCSALLKKGRVDADDDVFLRDLLERHPERDLKVGPGVDRFFIRRTEFGSNGFYLVRVDGSESDFSYKSCIRAPSHEDDVRQALRNDATDYAIAARDEAFRDDDTVPCALTGARVASDEADVAFLPPNDFASLSTAFLRSEAVSVEAVAVQSTADGVARWGLADRGLAGRWVAWLEKHAQPCMVSSVANRRRPRR